MGLKRISIDDKISSNQKQELLINLINNGKTFNEAVRKLNLSKSTLYYHYKKIYGKKIINPDFNISGSEVEGEIIGIFAADGGCCVCKNGNYQISFFIGGSEQEYCKRLSNLMENYFHKKPYIYKPRNKNVLILRYRSKRIYQFMERYLFWEGKKTYSIQLNRISVSKAFFKGFLRGYFDGDGYSDKNSRRIEINSVSKVMVEQIKYLMEKLGFTPNYTVKKDRFGLRTDLYRIRLNSRDAPRFIQFISPRNPNRIRKWGREDLNPGSTHFG